MALNWIARWWLSRLARAPRTPRRSRTKQPRRAHPILEELERRWLPAVTLSVSDPLPFPEGDSGTFGGGTTFATTTDANGRAAAPLTGNGVLGNPQVSATAAGGASPATAANHAPAALAASAVVFVNPAFTGPAGTTPPGAPPSEIIGVNAFATIQAALNAVAFGGTVNIAAGTYAENLILPRSVILVGAGSGTTTLAGKNVGGGVDITTAQGVVIKGLTVQGFVAGLIGGQATTYLELDDFKLNSNQFGGTVAGVTTMLITGGSGNDTFFVKPGVVGLGGNPLSYGVQFLTIDGGGGTNTLNVYLFGTSVADTLWVNANGIDRVNAAFLLFYRDTGGTFGGGVAVVLGIAPTTIVVQSQQTGVPLAIFANGGMDTFNVAVTTSSAYQNLTLDAAEVPPATVVVFDMSRGATGQLTGLPDGTFEFDVNYPSGSLSRIHEQNFLQPLQATVLVTM
jgi:hypothetical protein